MEQDYGGRGQCLQGDHDLDGGERSEGIDCINGARLNALRDFYESAVPTNCDGFLLRS